MLAAPVSAQLGEVDIGCWSKPIRRSMMSALRQQADIVLA